MRGLGPLLAIPLAVLCGCLPVIEVKSRTRVLEGGGAIRETVITKVRKKGDDEREKELNARPVAADLAAGLGDGFASVQRGDDELRLSGSFADANTIPPDFRRTVPGLEREARNHVVLVREDALFGTRYLYRERYADAVTPEDLKAAKRDAVRYLVDAAKAAVRLEFESRYDVSALEARIDADLGPLVDDCIQIWWSECARLGRKDVLTGKTGLDRVLERVTRRIERLGLHVDLTADPETWPPESARFLKALFAQTLLVKGAGGNAGAAPRPADFEYLVPADGGTQGLRIMWERAVERLYGSVQAAEEEWRRVQLGLTGTFGAGADAEFHFDCTVEMPGELLRSNGTFESDTSVFWLFEGGEVFPGGQVLEAESFVPDPAFVGRVRELKPVLGRRDAVRVIARLEDVDAARRARLRKLMESVCRAGTIDALVVPPEGSADAPPLTQEERRDREVLAGLLDSLRAND